MGTHQQVINNGILYRRFNRSRNWVHRERHRTNSTCLRRPYDRRQYYGCLRFARSDRAGTLSILYAELPATGIWQLHLELPAPIWQLYSYCQLVPLSKLVMLVVSSVRRMKRLL